MGTVYSTQRTNTRTNPAVMNQANELSGRVRIAWGQYEASSLSADEIIEMFILTNLIFL